MPPNVRIDAQTIHYKAGRNKILQGISLTILPGEFVGILGPSGCGKSTLMRMLSGQIAPSQGHALLNGKPPNSQEFRSQVGFVPQDDIVHHMLKVERALYFSARLRMPPETPSARINERVKEVIEMVELSERRRQRIDSLSGGQRKRVSIGVELLTEPALLFMDEPTSGLDPALEETLMELFRKLAQGGRTVVLTTHIMQSLYRLDMIAVIAKGQLLFYGRPWEVLAYFGVRELPDLYKLLSKDVEQQAGRFQASEYHRLYVHDRQLVRP
jgi:ABC-type multidrug transport system ATPase subunit